LPLDWDEWARAIEARGSWEVWAKGAAAWATAKE